ncbi:MAG: transposase, partial [Bacilli bacterium]
GNNESAGKRKSCHITKGNPYLKNMLCEIAWVIAGKRNAYLANWYWRLKSQKGAKRATIALARKILTVIFNMLKNLVPYDDPTYETLRLKYQKRKTERFIGELTKLGYQIVAPC